MTFMLDLLKRILKIAQMLLEEIGLGNFLEYFTF